MLKRLNVHEFTTVSISIVLAIGLTFPIVAQAPDTLGQSKTTLVSIVKGVSNPSITEP